MHLQKDLYEDVHGSFVHIIQKLESIQMATRGTNKQTLGYSYSGILFGNKKEWSTELCYNMDEPSKHFAK